MARDLVIALLIGVLDFALRCHGLPLGPIMIGVVLGPLAETSLRNAMMPSGDSSIMVGSPITHCGILALVLVYPVWRRDSAHVRQDA